jgi:hypothetical protein
MHNLACTLYNQNKLKEAEDLERECLRFRSRILHSDHFDIAETMLNLSFILEKQNNFSESEELQTKCLEIR